MRATQADKQLTNKRRTKDEQKTVRAARADKQMTKERRTKNEQMTVRATRADKQMTKEGQTNDEEMMKDNGKSLRIDYCRFKGGKLTSYLYIYAVLNLISL